METLLILMSVISFVNLGYTGDAFCFKSYKVHPSPPLAMSSSETLPSKEKKMLMSVLGCNAVTPKIDEMFL
jgi:hypothetical protein